MKKFNIYKIFIYVLFSYAIISCNNDNEENIFKQSSSQRINSIVKKYDNILKGSEYGWVLKFYPNKEKKYGGFNLAIKFDEKNVSKIYADYQNDLTKPKSSLYSVIHEGGPMLTFDTYNIFTHFYSTPNSQETDGRGGDFQYIILSYKDNIIELKGQTSGNIIQLVKLKEPIQSYLTKVKNVAEFFKGAFLTASINGKDIDFMREYNKLIFKDEKNEDIKAPFIFTPNGIKFYEEVTIAGNKVTELILDKDKRQLISLDKKISILVITPPINMFKQWKIDLNDKTNSSDKFYKLFETLKTKVIKRFSFLSLKKEIKFGNVFDTHDQTGIGFITFYKAKDKTFVPIYFLDFLGIKDKPKLCNIRKKKPDLMLSRFFPFCVDTVNEIVNNSPFEVEIINDNKSKFVSTKDSDFWFIITKK